MFAPAGGDCISRIIPLNTVDDIGPTLYDHSSRKRPTQLASFGPEEEKVLSSVAFQVMPRAQYASELGTLLRFLAK